jgi:hypothetical protein
MKKKISIFTTIFFISMIMMSSKVEAATCNHLLYNARIVDSQVSGWYTSSTEHTKYKVDFLQCGNCNAVYTMQTVYINGSHGWGSWQDLGHVTGTTNHKQQRYCTTSCGARQTDTYYCTGNPCRVPV